MSKDNFSAWNISSDDFSSKLSSLEKLIFFSRYAILAPSGHNTQPWELKKTNNALNLRVNPSHFLSADGSGLLSVEPYISLGSFLEVFDLAARGFGYKVSIDLFPTANTVASIKLAGHTTPDKSILDAIKNRVSNRNYYLKDSLDKTTLQDIISKNYSSVSKHLVRDRKDIDFIAVQTCNAIENIMSQASYRKELSKWVRVNHTRSYDGMPGFTHGFNDIQSLFSKLAIQYAPTQGPQGKKSQILVENSAALVIVQCMNSSKASFINAGRTYASICVLATKANIATSALGASVIDPQTRKLVMEYFGLKDRPIFIIRLGKATRAAKHSPRWPLDKIIR